MSGQIAVIASSSSYAIGFAKLMLAHRGDSPMQLFAARLAIAALLTLPFAARMRPPRPLYSADVPVLSLLELGLLGTGYAYLHPLRARRRRRSHDGAVGHVSHPGIGVVLGRLLLDESLGWNVLLGTALVVGGTALAEHGARSASAPRPNPR